MSIKTKLISVLSTVLVLAFVGTTLASYLVSKGNIRTRALNEILPLISSNIYSDVQRGLMQPIEISSMMANDTFLKDWAMAGEKNLNNITRYLKEIKKKYGFFTAFFVSDKSGNYYHYQGILKKINPKDSHDVWYYNFKNNNKLFSLDVDEDEASDHTLTVFINHRLNDYQGKLLGIVGVGLKMDRASKILRNYQQKYDRSVYLVNAQGVVQMHQDSSVIQKRRISDADWFGEQAKKIVELKEGTASFEIQRNERNVLLAVRYFKDFGWYLIVEQDEDRALSGIRAALYSNLALGCLVTAFIILIVVVTVNHYQGRLETLATTDELTGAPNRRHFLDMLDRELARAGRFGQSVSLLMVDADYFKAINDNYGHDTGDLALKLLSDTLSESLRQMDFMGRLGGEEFAVFLPQTRLKDAEDVAERVRLAVEERHLVTDQGPIGLTVTLGVATARPGKIDRKELIRAADRAMLEAKEAGRNRVGVAGELPV